MAGHVVDVDLGVHQVAVEILVVDPGAVEALREFRARRLEVGGGQAAARARRVGGLALEGLAQDPLGKPAGGLAEIPAHHVDDRIGKGDLRVRILDLLARQTLRDHRQRHVADHLRGGRDLDDVAEHAVHLGVGAGDLRPALLEAHRARLLLEVGELPAGHLVQVDLGGRGAEPGLEGGVLGADMLPVVGDLADAVEVEAGGAVGVVHGRDDRAEAGLRGAARERVHRRVDGVRARLGRGDDRGAGDPGGVVGVEVHRDVDLLLQRLDEGPRRRGAQQPRHVLEAEHVRARGLQLPAHRDVVGEVVLGPVGVEDVAGVADRALADAAALGHRVHGDAHVLDPVEAVEHPEHVDPGLGRLADELAHDVVGVVGVADAVGGPQQHLGQQVGHRGAQVAQPLPRAFLQEPVGDVEGRPAPALDAEQLRQVGGVGRRDPDHVDRAHARGEQRLVAVAHGGVGDQQPALRQHPVGDRLRPLALEKLLRALGRVAQGRRRLRRPRSGGRAGPVARLGMAVHGDVGDVGEHPGAAVAALGEAQQLGRRVDEAGGVLVRQEGGVLQQVLDEGDVGRHAADAELAQGAAEPGDRALRGLGVRGHLDEKRIVVAGDHPAGIGGAAVEADAHAGRLAERGDAAVVGDEAVLRILGGDPGLDGVAVERDSVLRFAAGRLGEGHALGDLDLGLDDVDPGHLLGHRVLDLDARIDLDEVELAGVGVHQELDGARAFVADMRAYPAPVFADLGALGVVEIGRRRALHDLLVAPLDRAVALEQMVQAAMPVAEDLDLDVAGARDHPLEIALAVAERRERLAAALERLLLELVGAVDPPHAAAAPAPGRLEHQRVSDLLRLAADLVHVVAEDPGGGDHRNPGLDRHLAGAGLVSEHAHGLGPRADEGDAVGLAGLGEVGILRKQPVAGMDRVGARLPGDADDLVDREIRLDRPEPLADPVGLVGLEAVQAELVLLGEDRDGRHAELVRGARDADGDLAAVGDENLAELGHVPSPRALRTGWLTSTPRRRCAQRGRRRQTAPGGADAAAARPRASVGEAIPICPMFASRSALRMAAR